MKLASGSSARRLCAVLAAVWIAAPVVFAINAQAQSQRANPPKSAGNSAAREHEDPLYPLLQQANEAIDKMDYAAAVGPLQKYIAQRPDEAYPHFQLGYAYAGLKRPADAKQEFSQALAIDPKMAPAYLNLGLVEMDSDPAAAADNFQHAAELQPTESQPRFMAGAALERTGKIAEAIEQYRAGVALSPKEFGGHFNLGRMLLRTNDAAGAEDQFRAALAVNPAAGTAKLGLGSALLAEKKWQAASDTLADYLKLEPGNKSAHTSRAVALLNLDQYDDALAELDLAAAGGAPSVEALKMRGEIYMRQQKWKEALDTLKQANAASPADSEIAEWIGHSEIELHDYASAVNILQQVYSHDPQSVEALRDLANAFYLNENYGAALAAMDRLAKMETPKAGSWFVRAICYDKLSRKAEAIDAYQKFLDQDGGQHDNQDFQARHRILVLQKELGQPRK